MLCVDAEFLWPAQAHSEASENWSQLVSSAVCECESQGPIQWRRVWRRNRRPVAAALRVCAPQHYVGLLSARTQVALVTSTPLRQALLAIYPGAKKRGGLLPAGAVLALIQNQEFNMQQALQFVEGL